jgi:hypothetical protein
MPSPVIIRHFPVIIRQRVRPAVAGPMTGSGGWSSNHEKSAITGCSAFAEHDNQRGIRSTGLMAMPAEDSFAATLMSAKS